MDEEDLYAAIEKGDEKAVATITEGNPTLIRADEDRPLRLSAGLGHYAIVQHLLNRGADVSSREEAALRAATSGGHHQVVQLLLDEGASAYCGRPAILVAAASSGSVPTLAVILGAGTWTTADLSQALHTAIMGSHVALVETLLNAGAPPRGLPFEAVTLENPRHPVVACASIGSVPIMKLLRPTKESLMVGENAALTLAIRGDHGEMVDHLLELGVQPTRFYNLEPFRSVIRHDRVAIFRRLFHHQRLDSGTLSFLIGSATFYSRLAILDELLMAGAMPSNYTVAMAAHEGHTAVVEKLLAMGVSAFFEKGEPPPRGRSARTRCSSAAIACGVQGEGLFLTFGR